MDKRLFALIAFILILGACSRYEGEDITGNAVADQTGIKIGPIGLNDNNERVHNIYNFDDVEKRVRVTTLCFDKRGRLIDDSDSYEMTLAPESISGWKPVCPEDTSDYRVDIEEIE